MSNEQLKHIFENSTCLTKKQMVGYVSGNMTNEEAHAVEVHLSSCAMCSDAVDGLFEQQGKAVETLNTINADFLQAHFEAATKTIHLNAASEQHTEVKKKQTINLWRTVSLAAGLLLLVVSVWYYRMLHDDVSKQQIAQGPFRAVCSLEPPPIAMNETLKEDNNVHKEISKPAPKTETAKALLAKEAMADDIVANAPAVASTEKKGKHANADEVVVTGYKAPLIGTDERKAIASDEIEKMPTRQTNAVATTAAVPAAHPQTSYGNSYTPNKNESVSLGGAKDEGTAYYVDGVKTLNKRTTTEKESEAVDLSNASKAIGEPSLVWADKLYKEKSYRDALNIYLREVNSSNDNDHKDEARIGAARCYIAVGDKVRAKAQLNAVMAKHGKYKREAKRLLKEIE